MTESLPFTEVWIVRVQPDVKLDTVKPEAQPFVEVVEIVKGRDGCLRQHWGHQVENPHLFVWCIDWDSLASRTRFVQSKLYSRQSPSLQHVFDYQTLPPKRIFVRWNRDATAALQSGVTEVAFFTLTKDKSEEARSTTVKALEPIDRAVVEYGNATGAASGWAQRVVEYNADELQLGEDWLVGAYGYETVEDHMKWRDHPEHEKAGEIFAELDRKGIGFAPAKVPGIDPATGYFHVHFQTKM